MKLLYVARKPTVHDVRFARHMVRAGIDVYLVHVEAGGGYPGAVWGEISGRILPPLSFGNASGEREVGRQVARLRDRLRAVQPDLVHAGPLTDCAYIAANAWSGPLVVASWSFDVFAEMSASSTLRARASAALEAADGVLCDCAPVRAALESLRPLDQCCVVEFPWGIEFDRMGPTSGAQAREPTSEGELSFLSLRRLEPGYDVPELLTAFEALREDFPGARLTIAGDGSLSGELKAAFGSSAGIDWLGEVPPSAVGGLLGRADVYVSSSPRDGVSVSLLEAMYCQLPVVVANHDGNRSWVTHGRNGWLFEPGDPTSMLDALRAAVQPSRAQLRAMGQCGRSIVSERANFVENVKQLFAMYERILDRS